LTIVETFLQELLVNTLICVSTENDLPVIHDWLKREYDQEGEGFYVNFNLIADAHQEGRLIVLRKDGEAVACQWGALIQPGILVVRPDQRGHGYGRALVEYRIQQALLDDEVCVLRIECNPPSSIPFWEQMGFKLVPDNEMVRLSGGYACRILNRQFELPADRPSVPVQIGFYPERAKSDAAVPALSEHRPQAVQLPDGSIMLAERVVGFLPKGNILDDLVVKIQVAGEVLYSGKAKYADEWGVESDGEGAFYLYYITRSETD
jgi:GNAT superfamily N-acetyltransferase